MATTSKTRKNKYIPHSGYHLIYHTFFSTDEFTEAVRGWDAEIHQLDRGRHKIEAFQVFGRFHLGHAQFHHKMEQLGTSPKNFYTFIIPSQKDLTYISRNKNITGNCIPIFQLEKELNTISDSNFDIIIYSLPREIGDKICHMLGIPKLFESLDIHDVVSCRPDQVEYIRNRFLQVIREIKIDPLNLINTNLIYELENTLPELLFETLAQPFGISEPVLTRKRTVAVRRIKDHLKDHAADLITVEKLCKISGYSIRTLEYVFQDYYGISPKTYLKNIRLNKVYKALQNSDPSQIKIADVANKWGYWHMGQFAADYRNLFGILPSETCTDKHK